MSETMCRTANWVLDPGPLDLGRGGEVSVTRCGLTFEKKFFPLCFPLTSKSGNLRGKAPPPETRALGMHGAQCPPASRQWPYLLSRGWPAAPGPAWLQHRTGGGGGGKAPHLWQRLRPVFSSFLVLHSPPFPTKLTDFTKSILFSAYCVQPRCSQNKAEKISVFLQVARKAAGVRSQMSRDGRGAQPWAWLLGTQVAGWQRAAKVRALGLMQQEWKERKGGLGREKALACVGQALLDSPPCPPSQQPHHQERPS